MSKVEDEDLDLTAVIKIIWSRRLFVFWAIGLCVLLGILYGIISSAQFTSKTVIIRDSASNERGGRLSRLAASLTGINPSVNSSSGEISPYLYPEVLVSNPFIEQLLEIHIDSKNYGKNIKLKDYLLNTHDDDLFESLKKNTIKLPGKIIKLFKSKKDSIIINKKNSNSIVTLTAEQARASKLLRESINIETDENTGTITISCNLNEPKPSAILTDHIRQMLEEFIKDYKTKKSREQLAFIQDQYEKKKQAYHATQAALANYRDANRIVSSSLGQTEEQSLIDEYNLAYSLYNQVSLQLENVKVELEQDKPVFTIIQPVILPRTASWPNYIKILFLSFFIGGFLGVASIFFIESKKYVQSKW